MNIKKQISTTNVEISRKHWIVLSLACFLYLKVVRGINMSEQNYSDPLKMWKQMYDVNEKYFGKMMNEYVQKEEFSEWMGSVIDFNLFCKKMLNDQSKTFLEASNIASKEDIANVASLVINLESKVDTLEDQLFLDSQPELDVAALKKELDIVTVKRDLTKLKAETKSIHQQVSELKSSMENIEQLKSSMANIEQLLQQLTTKQPTKQ